MEPHHLPARRRVVLFTPLGLNLAEVTRMIEVALRLPAHLEPVFQVHDEGFDHLVTEAGLRRVPGAPTFEERERAQLMAFDQGRALRHPYTEAVVASRVHAERRAVHELGAVAMVHGTNPTSVISARAEGIPLFYPVPYAWSGPMLRAGRPLPMLPDRGLGAIANRLFTRPVGYLATRAPLLPRSFRRVARANGVHLRAVFDLLGADVTLLTCLEDEIEGAELPPHTHLVGPVFAHLDAPIPPIVRELAEAERPLVYLAVGSSGRRRLVLDAAHALGAEDVEVIAPIRQYLAPGDEDRLPPNVHVVDLLPAHRLGPFVDAAVLHGGQGTLQTACHTGIPFLGVGLSAEQRWNVEVCVRRGNALALAASDLRPGGARLRASLVRVLHDPRIRAAAEATARAHRQIDGAERCAEIIARNIEESSPADPVPAHSSTDSPSREES